MNTHPETRKRLVFFITTWFIGFILIYLTYYLTEVFLETNFSFQGEAYYKGKGHLLKENLWKGIGFIIPRHFLPFAIIFYLIFYFLEGEKRIKAFLFMRNIWISIMATILIYVGVKVYDVISWGYTGKMRILEIFLTWVCRTGGFFFAYWLIKKKDRITSVS
ncbi:MAG: hypothetical protein R3B93_14300 [Bacteroidia bacterium]